MKSLYKMYLVSSRTLVYTMKKKTIKKNKRKQKRSSCSARLIMENRFSVKSFPEEKFARFYTRKRKTILKTQYASPLHKKKNGVALSHLAK